MYIVYFVDMRCRSYIRDIIENITIIRVRNNWYLVKQLELGKSKTCIRRGRYSFLFTLSRPS